MEENMETTIWGLELRVQGLEVQVYISPRMEAQTKNEKRSGNWDSVVYGLA